MSSRWTNRPQNICRPCGYTWFPRGKNRSLNSPRCGSEAVELEGERVFREAGACLVGPFILVVMLIQALALAFF
jgi:hypothetical protein